MDTGMTSLPTLTDASLGAAKVDPGWAFARENQILLGEWNAAMLAIKQACQFVGVDGSTAIGSSTGTVQGILRRLGWADPRHYRHLQHWEYQAAGAIDPRWLAATGSWLTVNGQQTYVEAPLDGGVENLLRMNGYHLYRAALPVVEARVRWTDCPNSPVTRIGVRDSGGTDGWGVEWFSGSSAFWRVYTLIGGAYVYVAFATTPATDVWSTVRVYLTGTPGAQTVVAEIDGVSTVSAVSAIANKDWSPLITVGSGAAAGKKFHVDYTAVEADFSIASS